MNLKDAVREAGFKRGVKLEGSPSILGKEWSYYHSDEYLYCTPKFEERFSAPYAVLLNLEEAISENWIVEPLPEPEKLYSLTIRSNFPQFPALCLGSPSATKSEILAAVKKWAEEA